HDHSGGGGALDHFLAILGVGLFADHGQDLHAGPVAAQQRTLVAVARRLLGTAFQTTARTVPQRLTLVAQQGLARRAFRLADRPLQLGARQAAVQFAVIAVADVPAWNDLGRRVRHIAVVDADGLQHD